MAGEVKVSLMDNITSAPGSAKMYIVLADGSYGFITKDQFLAGIGSVIPFATFQFLRKGFGNTGAVGEAGDIYQGWVSAGVFCPMAVYDGSGALDNPASFNIVTTHEI